MSHFPQKFLSLRKNPLHAQKNCFFALCGYGCPVYGCAVAHPTHHIHRPATNRKTDDNGAPDPPTLSLTPLLQKLFAIFGHRILRRHPQSKPPTFSPSRHLSPVALNHSFCSPRSQEASCSHEGTSRQGNKMPACPCTCDARAAAPGGSAAMNSRCIVFIVFGLASLEG